MTLARHLATFAGPACGERRIGRRLGPFARVTCGRCARTRAFRRMVWAEVERRIWRADS